MMLRNVGVEEFTPELKVYYNRLPVVNLDRLFSMGGVPGLVIQDGGIIGTETRICRGRCLKMVVIAFLLLFTLAGAVLICRAEGSRQEDWLEYIEQICEERNICPELVEAIIEQESSWNPRAINGDCIGLMQIHQIWQWPRTQRLGVVDLTDPYENILTGVDLLEELFEEHKEAAAVLMYYQAGNSERYGLEAYRRGEISDYALQVLERTAELEKLHGK
ncbi:MAG: lytic transglycosylase domain-containing protein [Lachnospiraceae bacterium]|nr:lytic transglycosylase domain-containing protein [Lachnospiraceae bacterium]